MTVMGASDCCARDGAESSVAAQRESKAKFSERMGILRGSGGSLPQEGGFGKETSSVLGIGSEMGPTPWGFCVWM